MGLKWFKKQAAAGAGAAAQRSAASLWDPGDYVPLQGAEDRLYRAVREAVPLVDAAIYKLCACAAVWTSAAPMWRRTSSCAAFSVRCLPDGDSSA